jgi:hypothetical protein
MKKELKIVDEELRVKLRAEFPDKAYSAHPTKTFLTTLKAMYVTERLNDVFGIGRWTIHVEIIERTADYILLQGEFESKDYDIVIPKQFGGHGTTGKGTEIADGYKSALTDCQSKIASYLEIGIEMFKGNINPPNKGANNSKYKFGDAKSDSLPWVSDANVKGMKEAISKGNKTAVIDSLIKYKWSKANKELITKELDNG